MKRWYPPEKALFLLSPKELEVLHALCFYHPDGMTKEADKICEKLRDQIEKEIMYLENRVDNFNVWEV